MNRITKRKNEQKRRKNKKKRKLTKSGSSGGKRQKTSGDDSEIGETKESDALSVIPLPKTVRRKLKLERDRLVVVNNAERSRQGYAQSAESQSPPCIAHIGKFIRGKYVKDQYIQGQLVKGKYVKAQFVVSKIIAFSSRIKPRDLFGFKPKTVTDNINKKLKSKIKKGEYQGQYVRFINAPIDMTGRVHCIDPTCKKHFGNERNMIKHVHKKHSGLLQCGPQRLYMPTEFAKFITSKQYGYIKEKIRNNILADTQTTIQKDDKVKLLAMDNIETFHKIARQICRYMIKKQMFASENVIDDNGGFLANGFEIRKHGGLFTISFDRIEDNYTDDNGQVFRKLHYPNPDNALENIHVVALMANVRYKASKVTIKERYDVLNKQSVEQRKKEFGKVLKNSAEAYHNGKRMPLYQHATNIWNQDKKCKAAFDSYKAYWQHLLVLLEKQEGLCAVGKIPMSLESDPWLMSCDAIDPRKGHVPDNLRLVCFYNNPTDFTKLKSDLSDTTPTSLTTEIHCEYWGIGR